MRTKLILPSHQIRALGAEAGPTRRDTWGGSVDEGRSRRSQRSGGVTYHSNAQAEALSSVGSLRDERSGCPAGGETRRAFSSRRDSTPAPRSLTPSSCPAPQTRGFPGLRGATFTFGVA